MVEGREFICKNCGEVFVRNDHSRHTFCSKQCAAENKRIMSRFRRELEKKKAEEMKKRKTILQVAEEGQKTNQIYGNYGTIQAQETLAMIHVDTKERIKQIREGWKK